MKERLFLLDAMALIYKYYFVFLSKPLTTSKGQNVGAIYGFVNFIFKILEEEKPDYISVLFDTKEPTFRHKAYKEYKATRQKMPEDMIPQMEKIKELVNAFNISLVEVPGFEADDLIGTLAKLAEKKNIDSYMVTGDKDFLQLISPNIKMYKPGKFGNEVEIVTEEEAKNKFGVPIENIIDVFALIGDSSDNVPGVPGIGEKTAIPLIKEFKTIENLYKNLDKIEKQSVLKKLNDHKDLAFLSKSLVTIDINVPLNLTFPELKVKEVNFEKLRTLFSELEFRNFLKKISNSEENLSVKDTTFVSNKEIQMDSVTDISQDKHDYKIINSLNELKELTKKLKKSKIISYDLETTSTDTMIAEIVGFAISDNERRAYYIPVFYDKDDNLFDDMKLNFSTEKIGLPVKEVLYELKEVLENEKIKKIGQNIKYDYVITKRHNIDISGIEFDTLIASYLIDSDGLHNQDALALKYLNYKMVPIKDLIGSGKNQKSMREVPLEIISNYSAEDADIALRLKYILEKLLEEHGMKKLCDEVEFPLIKVLAEMEMNGVRVDVPLLKKISKNLDASLKILENEIYDLAGERFNINSTKQLQTILFEKLRLSTGKKTKTGFSTNVTVLEDLKDQHPLANKLLQYRQQTKLKSTYIDALPELINPITGKIHTSFNQAIVSTGRLSSSDPNMQNIPVRNEIGKEIRKAFIPSKGNKIISADYSQIELRVMAHISKDENLCHAFKNNQDIHTSTAVNVFGVKPNEVTSDMRRKAKEVNFGIMYGIGAFGLKTRLNISQNEAKDIIDKYFAKYKNIKKYIDETILFARENGYVATLLGRRRYFKNINSKNQALRQFEERAAINMPIQGTAAEMIKIAMINIHDHIKKMELHSKMILQVHDELLFEVPEKELDKMSKLIKDQMQTSLPLDVPVIVDLGIGNNWFEAHQ